MSAQYSYELYQSIDEVDANEWRDVCSHANNLFLDPRFLKAVELSFESEAQFWYAVFRDANGRAVAATCFSLYQVDGALMAPRMLKNFVAGVRKVWAGFFKFRVLLCGIPVSTCDNQLSIVDGVEIDGILASLSKAAHEVARLAGCLLISFKEFSPEWAERLDGLLSLGFTKVRTVYAYHLKGEFGSFSNYLTSLRSGTRASTRRSMRRFDEAGLTSEQLRGRDGVDQLFTPDVYQLYLNVFERAEARFECIPVRFFQELARQLPDESCFTVFRQGERIIGFCCGLAGSDQHALLFVGRDYSISRESELYVNMVYRGLEHALVPGIQDVHFGSTADELKQRVGCEGAWLSAYMKGRRPLGNWLLKLTSRMLFDTRDATNAPPLSGKHRV